MPYINKHYRESARTHPTNPGELNFAITSMVLRYLEDLPLSYRYINDVMGALEGAKAEFYRRVVAPYEDQKKEANGDVYPQ